MVYEQYNEAVVGKREGMLTQIKYKQRVFRKYVVPQLPIDRNASILDCGCGFGAYLIYLRDLGYRRVAGVDLSTDQIAAAQKEFGLNNALVADAFEYLEKSGTTWDVIMLMDLIEHLTVDLSVALLKLANSRLAPGGKIIIMTPNAIAPFSPFLYGDITHLRAYTVASLEQTGRLAGLSDGFVVGVDPCGQTIKSRLQLIVVRFIITPVIRTLCKIYYGWDVWGIYTANLFCVFKRPE